MSMEDFIKTLTEEQRQALLKALTQDSTPAVQETEVAAKRTHDEDFRMNKTPTPSNKNSKRKEPVRAKQNMWTDTGEARNITTPETKRTPRERTPPVKVSINCHVCGKAFDIDKRYVFGEYNRCDRCASKK